MVGGKGGDESGNVDDDEVGIKDVGGNVVRVVMRVVMRMMMRLVLKMTLVVKMSMRMVVVKVVM